MVHGLRVHLLPEHRRRKTGLQNQRRVPQGVYTVYINTQCKIIFPEFFLPFFCSLGPPKKYNSNTSNSTLKSF